MVLECLRNSEAITAIQATRSGVRVPVESNECCTSYTLFSLPSYSSRRYFILVGFVYPRLLPLLFRQLLIHLYPFCLHFSLLIFKRVPVVTKSPILYSSCPSVSPSVHRAAPTEQISVTVYVGCVYYKSVEKIQICSGEGKNIVRFTRKNLLVRAKAVLI